MYVSEIAVNVIDWPKNLVVENELEWNPISELAKSLGSIYQDIHSPMLQICKKCVLRYTLSHRSIIHTAAASFPPLSVPTKYPRVIDKRSNELIEPTSVELGSRRIVPLHR